MPERHNQIDAFLDSAGWGNADRHPLADDASFRRYDRITEGARRAVLMDAPPPKEDVRPFLKIAQKLTKLGYSAPVIYASDIDAGLLLLEDLGDDTYTRVLARTSEADTEWQLYALAVDFLVDLHRRPTDETMPPDLLTYDEETLLAEALLFTDWYMPAVTGAETSADCCASYVDAWRQVLAPVLQVDATLVLRDFHVDNLISLPERAGVAACGVLDFQDALAGHQAYDVMSLLEDARRDIDDDLVAAMMARYLDALPDVNAVDFKRDFTILAAGRHAKVIGIFTRLCRRDAKPDYLVHIPRVWRLLERALAHPALAPVATWMDRFMPPVDRIVPPVADLSPPR
ncbi:MAG: phosphotransferase [Rhodospirillaceae bacterium]|jgi:N-acetylmuramate 1-kinase|nr:phosphotransferase [Rhodospirillaceae bacterium]